LAAQREGAVGDLVTGRLQQWCREMPCQLARRDIAAPEFAAAVERVGVGKLLAADAGLDGCALFIDERPQLVEEIGAEFSGWSRWSGRHRNCIHNSLLILWQRTR
jgi:hypothetical protein